MKWVWLAVVVTNLTDCEPTPNAKVRRQAEMMLRVCVQNAPSVQHKLQCYRMSRGFCADAGLETDCGEADLFIDPQAN